MALGHINALDSEISEMEQKLFKTTDSEDTDSTLDEQKNEDVVTEDEHTDDNEDSQALPTDEDITSDSVDEQDSDSDTTEDVQEEKDTPRQKRNDWKKRYKSLRSYHDSLVFDLRKDLSSVKASLIEAHKQNKELMERITELADNSPDNLFDEEEIELLGEEAVAAMKKVSDRSVKPLKEELQREKEKRLKAEEEEVIRLQNDNKRLFIERFSNLVPNYESIDRDPKFIEHMNSVDEFSGYTRVELFNRAVASGDVVRAANFYKDYLEAPKPKDILASKVTPTGTQNAVGPNVTKRQKVEIITTEFINKFYDDVVRGKYRGKLSLQQEIENKIDKAVMEGRIR